MRILKKLPTILKQELETKQKYFSHFNIYFEDESRFGLFTRNGRGLTIKGVKPICRYQHKFQNTYLFGAFSPVNGNSFMLDLPYCNSDTFQIFINEFSKETPDELKIIFLDNGAFHKAKRLKIPDNICLVFLPAYSPELNGAEKVWWVLKREISGLVFNTLSKLQKKLELIIKKKINKNSIKSLTAYDLFLSAYLTINNV